MLRSVNISSFDKPITIYSLATWIVPDLNTARAVLLTATSFVAIMAVAANGLPVVTGLIAFRMFLDS